MKHSQSFKAVEVDTNSSAGVARNETMPLRRAKYAQTHEFPNPTAEDLKDRPDSHWVLSWRQKIIKSVTAMLPGRNDASSRATVKYRANDPDDDLPFLNLKTPEFSSRDFEDHERPWQYSRAKRLYLYTAPARRFLYLNLARIVLYTLLLFCIVIEPVFKLIDWVKTSD